MGGSRNRRGSATKRPQHNVSPRTEEAQYIADPEGVPL